MDIEKVWHFSPRKKTLIYIPYLLYMVHERSESGQDNWSNFSDKVWLMNGDGWKKDTVTIDYNRLPDY